MERMVCQLGGSLKYRVYSRPVDMRKSFRGLAGIVHSEIGRQLSPEDVYVFVGKNRRTLKLLHREGHGLTLYTRKLDGVCFPKIEVDEEKNECVHIVCDVHKNGDRREVVGKNGSLHLLEFVKMVRN